MSEQNLPIIRHIKGDEYEIESDSGKVYFMNAAKPWCTCPHWQHRCRETRQLCKHLEWLAGLLAVQRACPVCEGKGWIWPSFGHADVPGEPPCWDPLACGTCNGSGTRAGADPYMLRLHDEGVQREAQGLPSDRDLRQLFR
jgi:hypothetical protein